MSNLQTVLVRFGRELGSSVERGDVDGVQGRCNLRRIRPACLLDSPLQNQSARVTSGRLVAGWRVVLRGISLGKVSSAGTVLRLEGNLRLPLRGHDHAYSGVAQLRPLWAVRRDQQRNHLQRNLVFVELLGERRAVGIVAAAQ